MLIVIHFVLLLHHCKAVHSMFNFPLVPSMFVPHSFGQYLGVVFEVLHHVGKSFQISEILNIFLMTAA